MSWTLFNVDESDSFKAIKILTLNIYKDVMQNSVWKKLWKKTINAKLVMLVINEIWQEEMSFKKINIMTSKWIFKLKMHVDDFLDKLKTRLIVRDFFQIHEVDYENTFTSIIKFNTLQVLSHSIFSSCAPLFHHIFLCSMNDNHWVREHSSTYVTTTSITNAKKTSFVFESRIEPKHRCIEYRQWRAEQRRCVIIKQHRHSHQEFTRASRAE